MAFDLKKIIPSGHAHRWNKALRGNWTFSYASPHEFLSAFDAGATGLFYGYFFLVTFG
jgi:hypothetical protein